MGFGFDESTPVVAGGGKKINTMGINVVKISKLEVVSNDLGTYLDVEVANKQGQTANQRYYEPIIGKAGVTEENIGWKTNAIIAFVLGKDDAYGDALFHFDEVACGIVY